MRLRRLPDTELAVLKALWASGGPTSRAQLEIALKDKHWAGNTINTYLARLVDKEVISCQKQGKSNYYLPLVTQESYLEFEGKLVLHRLFGSSVKNFVATLVQGGELEQAELDELSRYLDEQKGDG